MNQSDIAWFAGFYEGEGSVRMGSQVHRKNGRDYGAPVLDICQVNKEPLEKCATLFPESHLYGPYQYHGNRQPHYKWTVCGRKNVEALYTLISSYLSSRRVEQFKKTFEQHAKLIDRPKLKMGPKPKAQREVAE